MLLNGETNTSSVHQNVENLVERAEVIDSNIRAVVSGDVLTSERITRSHKTAHRRHHFKVQNSLLKLVASLLGQLRV